MCARPFSGNPGSATGAGTIRVCRPHVQPHAAKGGSRVERDSGSAQRDRVTLVVSDGEPIGESGKLSGARSARPAPPGLFRVPLRRRRAAPAAAGARRVEVPLPPNLGEQLLQPPRPGRDPRRSAEQQRDGGTRSQLHARIRGPASSIGPSARSPASSSTSTTSCSWAI